MATAADYVIAEVEEMVELGELDPDCIHTPGIYVDAIFQGSELQEAASKAAPCESARRQTCQPKSTSAK